MGASVLLLHAEIKDESRSGAGCKADAKEGPALRRPLSQKTKPPDTTGAEL